MKSKTYDLNKIFFPYFVNKKTPLHYAVEMGYIDVIKLLLKNKNIDVNVKDAIQKEIKSN